jgi:AcrR family transcriptional regulator
MTETQERTREALIRALVRLLEERSYDRVSVRDIAAEAGVNHGLVHRYFGSKENLLREAVRWFSEGIHRGDPVHRGLSAWSFDYLRRQPEIARVMARACLDGPPDLLALAAPTRSRLDEIVAPIRAALESIGLVAAIDPYLLNGLASAMFLGWFVFKPLLESGYAVPADAEAQIAALLVRLDALLTPFRKSAPAGQPM